MDRLNKRRFFHLMGDTHLTFFTGQVGSGLPVEFQQAETDADLSIAFGFRTLRLEQAVTQSKHS